MGIFFIIALPSEPIILVGEQRYKTEAQAKEAAESMVLLGSQKGIYRNSNQSATQEYSFELVFKPVNYLEYLQNLTESEEAYCQRRNQFLDHLLARFAESFTDYALLLFNVENNSDTPSKKLLETKPVFYQIIPKSAEIGAKPLITN